MAELENELDYSNTIIYKISCKDHSITDLYVGHTINFVQRQMAHKNSCNNEKSSNYNCKLYQIIRENGGWNNWTMSIVNFFNCTNKTEAREKEQEYYKLLNANLNSVEPLPIRNKNKCLKADLNNTENEIIKHDNTSQFACNICKYYTCRKSQYDRHNSTMKHKQNTNSENYTTNLQNKIYKCICGKIYKYDSGYYRHKRQCTKQNLDNDIITIHKELKEKINEVFEIMNKLNIS